VFRMYAPFQDARYLPLQIDAGTWKLGEITLPRVDAIAAKDAEGRVLLAFANVDPTRPATLVVDIAGAAVGSASGETLTAPRVDSINTFDAPGVVAPKTLATTLHAGRLQVTLEPKSVSVITLSP
jgi:alpha-L-arabinofuranosidase